MLREIRKHTGWTQTQAAQIAHVTMRAYQRWEAGERPPQGAALELLIAKAGLPPNWTPPVDLPPEEPEEERAAVVDGMTVRAFRARFRMTPQQAADVVRVTAAVWNRWESGHSKMPPSALEVACLKLGEDFEAWYPEPAPAPMLPADEAAARVSAALRPRTPR